MLCFGSGARVLCKSSSGSWCLSQSAPLACLIFCPSLSVSERHLSVPIVTWVPIHWDCGGGHQTLWTPVRWRENYSSYTITTGDSNEKILDFWSNVLILKQKAGNGCGRHSRRFIKDVSSCSPRLLFCFMRVGIGTLPHLSFSLCLRHLYLDKSNLFKLHALGHSPCWCPLLCDDGLDYLQLARVELCSPSPTAQYQNHIVMATLRTELKP